MAGAATSHDARTAPSIVPAPAPAAAAAAQDALTVIENVVLEGCPGCHFVDTAAPTSTPWLLGVRRGKVPAPPEPDCRVALNERPGGDGPVLTVTNLALHPRAAYISATPAPGAPSGAGVAATARGGATLAVGRTATDEGSPATHVPCITFVARLEPRSVTAVAELRGCAPAATADGDDDAAEVAVSSLSFELLQHPEPYPRSAAARFGTFPLGGPGPFLCTQGVGGRLTHFFPESFHAFDLRCAVGTAVVAVADGEVVEARHDCRCTGVHCDNLTDWNSVGLAVGDGAIIVEYLHLAPGSITVAVGDKVVAGDLLCLSGQTGFAPEPHVHIEAHAANDRHGPSLLIELCTRGGTAYVPEAGRWYGPEGEVEPPRSP